MWEASKLNERVNTSVAQLVLATLPSLALLPATLSPLPDGVYPGRTLGGYFQTSGYVDYGLSSVLFQTPVESASNPIHLHSLLSAPLFASGVVQAGRIVSLVAAVLSAYVIARVSSAYVDERLGYVSVVLFWAQPKVVRAAILWQPETLSVLFTTTSILFLKIYHDSGREGFFYASLILLILSPMIHLWEAVVGLPLFVMCLRKERLREAFSVAVADFGSVAAVHFGGALLFESQGKYFSWWGIYNTLGDPFLRVQWWEGVPGGAGNPIYWLNSAGMLPAASLIVCLFGIWWYTTGEEFPALITNWTFAGLFVVLFLPGGYSDHSYFTWGVWGPVTVACSYALYYLISTVDINREHAHRATRAVVVALLCVSLLYSTVFIHGVGVTDTYTYNTVDTRTEQLKAAGVDLRQTGVTDERQVAFLGSWRHLSNNRYNGEIGVVLAYARLTPTRWGGPGGTESSEVEGNITAGTDYCVLSKQTEVVTSACEPPSQSLGVETLSAKVDDNGSVTFRGTLLGRGGNNWVTVQFFYWEKGNKSSIREVGERVMMKSGRVQYTLDDAQAGEEYVYHLRVDTPSGKSGWGGNVQFVA